MLMGKLENRIMDRRLLRIIRRYLEAGIMADGVVTEAGRRTSQGGPSGSLREAPVLRVAASHADRWWHLAAHRALQIARPGQYFENLGVLRLV